MTATNRLLHVLNFEPSPILSIIIISSIIVVVDFDVVDVVAPQFNV